jgi:membrane protease YdiL (CAAX protease family)
VRIFETRAEQLLSGRAASSLTIVASMLVAWTWLLLLWSVVYRQPWVSSLIRGTDGLVDSTLIGSMLGMLVQLAVMLGMGRLALRDIGIAPRTLAIGAGLMMAMWAVSQLVQIAVGGAFLAPSTDSLGALIGQVFGNAFAEEVLYRGFLFIQLVFVARRFTGPRRAWIIGLLASQLFFAVTHIPHRWLMQDMHGTELAGNLARVMWNGIVWAVVYVRTGNLGICVISHALSNEQFTLFPSAIPQWILMQVLTAVLFLAWPWLRSSRPPS